MSTHASTHSPARPARRAPRSDASGFYAAISVILGLLVGVLGLVSVLMWVDAHNSRNAANHAAVKDQAAAAPLSVDAHAHATAAGLESHSGAAPPNAAALAAAHKPFPASLPAAPAGPVANVDLVLKDVTVQIAPGVKYAAWAWAFI